PCSRAAFQAETRHVSMDEHGVDPDELDRALTEAERQGRKVKFFYTVPNFQNPAGITMTAERRKIGRASWRERGWRSVMYGAEDGVRDRTVTGVQTCALPIFHAHVPPSRPKPGT